MDFTPDFLLNKIPVGRWVRHLVEFLTDNFDEQFRLFSGGLEWMIQIALDLFGNIPPLILIAAICGAAYFLHRSWKTAAGILPALLLVLNLGYWQQTVETVTLVFFATFISVVFGVPVGIVAAHRRWLFTFIRPYSI
jgi:glycine betaine/proline transport system permease protein